MIIRIALSVGLAFILAYYLLNNRRIDVTTYIALIGAASGLFFVWNPEKSNDIAVFVGVGRGADLIFYCLGLIGAALVLTLYVKIRQLDQVMTKFVRETAIAEALPRRTPDEISA